VSIPTRKERSAPVPVRPSRAPDSGREVYARTAPSAIQPYQIAQIPEGRRTPDDLHDDRYGAELRELLHGALVLEAPVALRVLARRIAPYFKIHRTSSRLEDRLRSVLGRSVTIKDDIVWRLDQDPTTYAVARLAPNEARREAPEVPLEEVANAALSVLRGAIALEHDELVKLTARALGFARTGERVAEHMSAGLELLVKRGAAKRDGAKLVVT
jgi:hypothetical protein